MRPRALLLSFACLTLTGCVGFSPNSAPTQSTEALSIQGNVHGGQQPVSGSTIQLYAIGTTATGSASAALIASTVTTNASGGFSISGDYTCGTSTQVYLVATGGNPGGGTNSNFAEAVVLGPCSGLTPGTFVQINELTTVAAAYALAPFEGATYTNIGSNFTATGSGTSSTGAIGITNAFTGAQTLVSSASGTFPALPAGLTEPTAELNTLADILASCVNTTGASSSQCTTLFSDTANATNTFDAAFYIAKHPGTNVAALYALATATGPYQPTLAAAPKDFTVALNFTSAALSKPSGIAIDAQGNAFVTNQTGNTVTGFTPLSTTFTNGSSTAASAGGLSGPQGIAIDTNGYSWIANTGGANVVRLAPLTNGNGLVTGLSSVNSRSTALASGDKPIGVATDLNGNAYFVSETNNKAIAVSAGGSVVEITPSSFPYPSAIALSNPSTVAIGTLDGTICTTNTALSTTPTCTAQGSVTGIGALSYNTSASSVGYAGATAQGISMFNSLDYGPYLNAPSAGVSYISTPTALAIDSAGNAFITASAYPTTNNEGVTEFTGTTQDSPYFGYSTTSSSLGVAVDPSGNVWTTNSGDNSISIFVGLGAPTITPIAANLH